MGQGKYAILIVPFAGSDRLNQAAIAYSRRTLPQESWDAVT